MSLTIHMQSDILRYSLSRTIVIAVLSLGISMLNETAKNPLLTWGGSISSAQKSSLRDLSLPLAFPTQPSTSHLPPLRVSKVAPPKSCWKDPLCVFFIPYAFRNNRTFCSTSQNTLTKAPSCHYMPRSVQISMGKIPAIVIAIAVPAWPGKAAGYSLPQNRISVCLSSQVTPRIRKCPSLKFKRKKKKSWRSLPHFSSLEFWFL